MLDNPSTTVVVFLVLMSIVSVIKQVVDIIRGGRRQPSVDQELQAYARRVEVEKSLADVKAEQVEIWRVINGERTTMRRTIEEINRALGRIEGEIKSLSSKS